MRPQPCKAQSDGIFGSCCLQKCNFRNFQKTALYKYIIHNYYYYQIHFYIFFRIRSRRLCGLKECGLKTTRKVQLKDCSWENQKVGEPSEEPSKIDFGHCPFYSVNFKTPFRTHIATCDYKSQLASCDRTSSSHSLQNTIFGITR